MLTFKPGDVYAGLQIVRLIGAGAHSEVWLVLTPTNALAALKIRKGDVTNRKKLEERLAHEGEILSMIKHVNVVRFLGAGLDAHRVRILLEYVEGRSFREVLRHRPGPLPLEQVVRWARQVCDGLAAVHKVNAVHRDIKPENLLVTPSDVVKIIDFDVVKLPGWGVKTTMEQTVGTVLYMSPQQLLAWDEGKEQKAKADPRSDLYSLGMVLYELVTGKHPLMTDGAQTTFTICGRHFHYQVPPLRELRPDAPDQLEVLLAQAMAKEPAQRPASAEAFAEELETVHEALLGPLRAEARRAIPDPDPSLAATDPIPPSAREAARSAESNKPTPPPRRPSYGTVPMAAFKPTQHPASRPSRGTVPMAVYNPSPISAPATRPPQEGPDESGVRESVRTPGAPTASPTSESSVRPSVRAPLPSNPTGMPAPALTVEQYASLCVDLEAYPQHRAAILQRYGLTPELKVAIDADYQQRIRRESSVAAAFDIAQRKYREWLRSARRG